MRDVLDYTEEELRALPTDELQKLLLEAKNKESLKNTSQLVQKTLINSLYGAMANVYFPLFNENMAAAITGNGRYFIRKLSKYIEDSLQSYIPSKKPYVLYSDTDSCVGSTVVKTNQGNIKIEDLFHTLSGHVEVKGKNNFVKHVNEKILAGSVSNESGNLEYQEKQIKYVMKHKVKKRMFKVKCAGDEVIITEDHSIIVYRNGTLVEIKPTEVKKTDKIVKIIKNYDMINFIQEFEIEDLGVQEEWVYDIEVQDNHNFFGNDILIHNSAYFQIEPFMDAYQEKNPGLSVNEYVDWANEFEKKVIQPVIQKTIDDFSEELNAFNKSKIGAEREIIADSAVFAAKKKYYARVRDNEGTRYPENNPKIKVMGLEIIKSSTPKWSQKYLKEAIPHILDKDEDDLRNWVKEIKSDFVKVNPNEIASVGGVTRIDYNLNDKGVPIGSRAALVHNTYVLQNNLGDKYQLIQGGDKCKRLFLTVPNKFNSNITAYIDDRFVNEIDCIDYDTQFDKTFLKPLELMVEALNYDLRKETETLDDW